MVARTEETHTERVMVITETHEKKNHTDRTVMVILENAFVANAAMMGPLGKVHISKIMAHIDAAHLWPHNPTAFASRSACIYDFWFRR